MEAAGSILVPLDDNDRLRFFGMFCFTTNRSSEYELSTNQKSENRSITKLSECQSMRFYVVSWNDVDSQTVPDSVDSLRSQKMQNDSNSTNSKWTMNCFSSLFSPIFCCGIPSDFGLTAVLYHWSVAAERLSLSPISVLSISSPMRGLCTFAVSHSSCCRLCGAAMTRSDILHWALCIVEHVLSVDVDSNSTEFPFDSPKTNGHFLWNQQSPTVWIHRVHWKHRNGSNLKRDRHGVGRLHSMNVFVHRFYLKQIQIIWLLITTISIQRGTQHGNDPISANLA